jgi:hypothetical protein
MTEPTMTIQEFHALPEIIEAQEIQKRNRYGSKAHRDAYLTILHKAEEIGAAQHFESIEIYDEDAADMPWFNK